ncbi:hypothetical protein LCGC14_3160990 [marine sediment metagenome]|uniref:Uncharacterized protein n=1 Tax=marine sediment metagenome TaxID=412755 RepID=A0A0F8VRC9_9ZZZZ
MIYICIIRKIGQRVVVSANTCRFRLNSDNKTFYIEGITQAPAKYDSTKECIFFTKNDQTVIDFIKKKPINERDIEYLNEKKKWNVNPKTRKKKKGKIL